MQTTRTGIPAASAAISRESKQGGRAVKAAPGIAPRPEGRGFSSLELLILLSLSLGSLLFVAGKYTGAFGFVFRISAGANPAAMPLYSTAWAAAFLLAYLISLFYSGMKHGYGAPTLTAAVMLALEFSYLALGVIAGTVAAVLIFLPLPFYYLGMGGMPISRIKQWLGFTGTKPGRALLIGIGAYVLAIAISLLLGLALTLAGVSDSAKIAEKVGSLPLEVLFFAIAISPIAEEVFFRGFLQQKIGLAPASVLFALAHISYFSVSEIAGALAMGLFLGLIFKYSKNIYAVIIAHALYNLTSIIAITFFF
ncbi:MAG: type II CAAX endopeptidase family protein [Candidatus Micrarchaeia archaeon]